MVSFLARAEELSRFPHQPNIGFEQVTEWALVGSARRVDFSDPSAPMRHLARVPATCSVHHEYRHGRSYYYHILGMQVVRPHNVGFLRKSCK